ncbi:MAG: MmcQ/YjbR family DNA-binding protein [Clostridia bacterium]|nr:MmcQ/YjbR family DNA-binding protein [Clostridia bacterium]
MFEDIFRRRKLNVDKLMRYGFESKESHWSYDTTIMNGAFILHVSVSKNGDVGTDLVESETNEPYILYKTNASGTFVGEVRAEIEKILKKIADECFEFSVFKTEQAFRIIDYVQNTYGDELEFLWTKFPDNAIWRRKDNNKWYGAILTVSRNKLGLSSNEVVEIIDLRLEKEQIPKTVDNKRYFPGWHMNKNSWYTIILDNSVSTEEICCRIDESYKLAKK